MIWFVAAVAVAQVLFVIGGYLREVYLERKRMRCQ